jgi:hypothetical protein
MHPSVGGGEAVSKVLLGEKTYDVLQDLAAATDDVADGLYNYFAGEVDE